MPYTVLLDIAGRRRSPATLPASHAGRPPHNKGLRYPADPPTVEEIVAVMRAAGDDAEGVRLRGLVVVLWRAGLRISEALALAESHLDANRGAILVRRINSRPGSRFVGGCRSVRCSASCVARRAGGPGRPPAFAPNCMLPLLAPGSGGDSRRINCATPTWWRCHGKAYHCSSSSANSDTPTSPSPPCTSAASTTPRSSTPSTTASTYGACEQPTGVRSLNSEGRAR
jgi:hypothetical protein